MNSRSPLFKCSWLLFLNLQWITFHELMFTHFYFKCSFHLFISCSTTIIPVQIVTLSTDTYRSRVFPMTYDGFKKEETSMSFNRFFVWLFFFFFPFTFGFYWCMHGLESSIKWNKTTVWREWTWRYNVSFGTKVRLAFSPHTFTTKQTNMYFIHFIDHTDNTK